MHDPRLVPICQPSLVLAAFPLGDCGKAMADLLIGVRNKFFAGDHQGALQEIEGMLSRGEGPRAEVEVFLYRCNIAQGKYKFVKSSIAPDASSPVLLSLRLLASYYDTENHAPILESLSQMERDSHFAGNTIFRTVQSVILSHEDRLEEAFTCLQNLPDSLEIFALRINLLLTMNRIPLAAQELAKMRGINSEATITRLAAAVVALHQDQVDDALGTYQDLKEKYGATSYLLAAQAAAILRKKPRDLANATTLLKEALRAAPYNYDAMASLLVCYLHRMAPEDIAQADFLRRQLQTEAPWHPYVTRMKNAEAALNAAVAMVQPQ
ncbi:Coatomer subunit epsilon (CopE) [Paratrimastix pyriformis]|uniref:Coatomer subunit epsilon (CopE) n=1 Tax=Paratrimastix pyriformis TaxID=342808 RepID=A0ABQ8UBJ7_9EUKA|nr:Coatomer subunit epsilon (CopE) [Paratrimastix pyriformis]